MSNVFLKPIKQLRAARDLLLSRRTPRETADAEHECASRSPSPLLVEMPQQPIIAALDVSVAGTSRSLITHAVLGSEAAGLHSLPQELLFLIFCRLDTPTLCRLSCVSHSCESFAMDPLVWERTVGHV